MKTLICIGFIILLFVFLMFNCDTCSDYVLKQTGFEQQEQQKIKMRKKTRWINKISRETRYDQITPYKKFSKS